MVSFLIEKERSGKSSRCSTYRCKICQLRSTTVLLDVRVKASNSSVKYVREGIDYFESSIALVSAEGEHADAEQKMLAEV